MKKTIALILASCALAIAAIAQETPQEYYDKYLRLTSRLGYDGVGIETFIDKWEASFPEDGKMLEARCNYYLVKSMQTKAVPKNQSKFLGEAPFMTLKDSTGADINYFEEQFFDDEVFGKAVSCIDKAISIYPSELVYRADKVSLLLAYEKESPDMAVAEINALIELQKSAHPTWTVDGQPISADDFASVMSGYCVRLYNVGSPVAYEAFGKISQDLSKLFPEDSNFLDNIGSYWLVYKDNERKALKYYRKALKINPEDSVAQRNISLIERRREQRKNAKNK